MRTCPLIDYLAWTPFVVAVVAAVAVAGAGVVLQSREILSRAVGVFTTVILAGSALSVVTIAALAGLC